MNGRRLAAMLVGVFFVAALTLGTGAAPSGAKAEKAKTPDVTQLFRRATLIVRATDPPLYAAAVPLEADGQTAGPPTTSADGIVKWKFWFNNIPSFSPYDSAYIEYGPPPLRFSPVTGSPDFFAEDEPMVKMPAMTLKQAVKILQKAGYTDGFYGVTLRRAFGEGLWPYPPLYIFTFTAQQYIAVNAWTKEVAPMA